MHGGKPIDAAPPRWKAILGSVGAFLAALVAGSHHSLHMLLLSVGLGGSALFFNDGVRRAMLVVSFAMTLLSGWWLVRRPQRSGAETLALSTALGASIVLLVGSLFRDGW